jgi:rhodanese-related sulfurtransferase
MRVALKQAGLLALIALILAFGTAVFHPKRPSWNPEAPRHGEVVLTEVLAWTEKPLWVDARTRNHYEKDHIPGAILLNEDEWNSLAKDTFDAWTPGQSVVVYCDTRQCQSSHKVAERLRESGLSPVYVLQGGWEAWQNARK